MVFLESEPLAKDRSNNHFALSGRRVVELGILAIALDSGCKACCTPLKLTNCIEETLSGLGSFLYIESSNRECGELKCVLYEQDSSCCRHNSRTADL